jgi:hypothetical protein
MRWDQDLSGALFLQLWSGKALDWHCLNPMRPVRRNATNQDTVQFQARAKGVLASALRDLWIEGAPPVSNRLATLPRQIFVGSFPKLKLAPVPGMETSRRDVVTRQ